jgi:hypothetical protein
MRWMLGTQGHGKCMWGGIKVWWKTQYKWSGIGGISRFLWHNFLWVYDVNKYLEVLLCFFFVGTYILQLYVKVICNWRWAFCYCFPRCLYSVDTFLWFNGVVVSYNSMVLSSYSSFMEINLYSLVMAILKL